MNKNIRSRNGFIHLYNPRKEGLGSYDFHYINAYKKNQLLGKNISLKNEKRKAA
tara:strand:- start:285 stop:446 length:162 start_codon:yes stop_codon:yes gene_type:complete